MSESTIAQIHPVFGDILTRFGLPPRDPSIMTDQHDPATQPSLQGQAAIRCVKCGHRGETSYDGFCVRADCDCQCEPAKDRSARASAAESASADSVLVDQVAAVLVRCLAAAKGEQSQAFDELPPAERQRYRDVARIAWSLCDQEAIQIAHWIAADRLIWERTNHGWTQATGKERRAAFGDARVAVTSARQYWLGLLSPEFAAEARRALAEMAQGKVAAFVPSAFLGGQ